MLLSQLLLVLLHGTIQDTGIVAHADVGSAITDHVSGIGRSGSGGHRQEGRRRTRPRSNVMMMVVVMVMTMVVHQMMMIAQDITDQ